MSSKYKRMKREKRIRNWIFLRYAMPMITVIVTLIFMAIPSLQYTNNQTGTDEPVSAFTLMGNSWDEVRQCLFGTAQQTDRDIIFSRTVLICLIVFWLLFAVSVAVAAWSLWAAVRYTEQESEEDRGRIWFVTLIPNRIALTVYGMLMIPLAAFPRLLPLLFPNLYVAVTLDVRGVDPLWAVFVLTVATVIVSAATAGYEKKWKADPFRKPNSSKYEEEEVDAEEIVADSANDNRWHSEEEESQYRAQVDRVAAMFVIDHQKDEEKK